VGRPGAGLSPHDALCARSRVPGVVWVCALLPRIVWVMLSVSSLYAGDLADGSLEQMLLSGRLAR
jgi:heme exporter protein B